MFAMFMSSKLESTILIDKFPLTLKSSFGIIPILKCIKKNI